MATNRSSKRKDVSLLLSKIRPLARELVRIKKQAEAMGIFTNDREFLECCGCDLAEDVAFDGRLMTYHRKSEDYTDSGLRFERLNETTFRCPICKTKLKAKML
jgi:hypothetical protein